MKCIKITQKNRTRFLRQIVALERSASYPLGGDHFTLSHGEDYFSSFERLGDLHYYAVLDGTRVAAVAAGIIRQVPLLRGEWPARAWYLCDLKIHPDYRNRPMIFRILRRTFIPNYLRCRRGYAISLNPGEGRPNRLARLLGRFHWAPLSTAGILQIYSLSVEQMRASRALVEKFRGPVSFLSLEGTRDMTLRSTGKTMDVLHVQFGPCAEPSIDEPRPGFQHLLGVPAGDALEGAMSALGIQAFANASILQHGMKGCDWKFILTSEI